MKTNQIRNKLDAESSPYLKQHKDNPVHWQPWGEEAFNLAKETKKPIMLSIGYASCHWCHVIALTAVLFACATACDCAHCGALCLCDCVRACAVSAAVGAERRPA